MFWTEHDTIIPIVHYCNSDKNVTSSEKHNLYMFSTNLITITSLILLQFIYMSCRHVVQHRNKQGKSERQVVCITFTARHISKLELSEKSSFNQTLFNTFTARHISKPELSEKSSFNQIVWHMCLKNYGPALLTIPSEAVWTLDREFLFVY